MDTLSLSLHLYSFICFFSHLFFSHNKSTLTIWHLPAIPKHFWPGTRQARPRTLLDGVGGDLEAREKNFDPSPVRNVVFSYFTL
jgi:hypothetical protein